MNAGLQCLSHVEPLVSYFLSGEFRKEINKTNKLGSGGKLVDAFALLQKELWQNTARVHEPRALRHTCSKLAPFLFDGMQQQDVHEFLAFLIDGLHEDLNLVLQRPPPKIDTGDEEDHEMKRLEQENGEEYVAALSWMEHLRRNKSFLVDLLQGQLRSVVICSVCGCESKAFDPFLYITLPVNSKMQTLEEAIIDFLAIEKLDGDNCWKCPRCKKRVEATKKIDIWKMPPVLVVQLKRFKFDRRRRDFAKIKGLIKVPMHVDLTRFVSSPRQEDQVYDVVGVANHHGSYGHGHYTASCWHAVEKKFFRYDDTKVAEQASGTVITQDAYILVLHRRAGKIRRQSLTMPDQWPFAISATNSVMLGAIPGECRTAAINRLAPASKLRVLIRSIAEHAQSSSGSAGDDMRGESSKASKALETGVREGNYREAFRTLDADGDGYISKADLIAATANLEYQLAERDADEIVKESKDGCGKIGYQAFVNLMQVKE
jgi:ubiquitin carboxyl-terminal hydrolase 8